jgi:hypothetical protein
MSARQLIEIGTYLIRDHIKANISTALADIRVDRADAKVSTEPPQSQSYFFYPKAKGYKTPAIFIIGDAIDFNQETYQANFVRGAARFNVTALVEDRMAELVTIKAWRYQAALHAILDQANLVDANSKLKIFVRVSNVELSPLYSDTVDENSPKAVFRKEAVLALTVEHCENF